MQNKYTYQEFKAFTRFLALYLLQSLFFFYLSLCVLRAGFRSLARCSCYSQTQTVASHTILNGEVFPITLNTEFFFLQFHEICELKYMKKSNKQMIYKETPRLLYWCLNLPQTHPIQNGEVFHVTLNRGSFFFMYGCIKFVNSNMKKKKEKKNR